MRQEDKKTWPPGGDQLYLLSSLQNGPTRAPPAQAWPRRADPLPGLSFSFSLTLFTAHVPRHITGTQSTAAQSIYTVTILI